MNSVASFFFSGDAKSHVAQEGVPVGFLGYTQVTISGWFFFVLWQTDEFVRMCYCVV